MKLAIRQRDRRALLLLLIAMALYGGLRLLVLPRYDRLALAADVVAEKETQLRRYRRAELRKGQYAELTKLANLKIQQNESVISQAGNESFASAELQSMVEAAAGKVGLMLSQRSVGSSRRINEFYAELPMTLGFEGTPGQLVMFLSELRALPQLVIVHSAQVTPVQPVQEAPKGLDVTKNVRVNMTIAAWCRADIVKK
jgi:Tfp pilus assembly protein PilO